MKENKQYDVIIAGAGAAGLMAAWKLAKADKRVLILEAKKRCGGRIHTITDEAFPMPIEMGAEFVHGKLPITKMLVKKAGLKWHKVKGSFWENRNGKWQKAKEQIPNQEAVIKALQQVEKDITIAEFLNTYFPDNNLVKEGLSSYIEGYYAGDINKVSTLALRQELKEGDERQYRIEGGYITIIDFLVKEVKKVDVTIQLETPVTSIDWQHNYVKIIAESKTYQASKVIVTAPLGVLKANGIQFYPTIPELQTALQGLGFGTAIKFNLSFKSAFWRENKKHKNLSMFFSDQVIPTWWTQYPKQVPLLTGWVAGGETKDLVHLNKEVLLEKALQSLSTIFNKPFKELQKELKGWYVNNWFKGIYAKGAYSYDTINGSEIKNQMKTGIQNTIFFTGEGWFDGLELGTVEAALNNGNTTAQNIISND